MRTTKLAANQGLQGGVFIGFEVGCVAWFVRSNDSIGTIKLDAIGIFRSVDWFC